jgi:protein ImuA
MDRFGPQPRLATARARLHALERLRTRDRPSLPRLPFGDATLDRATAGGLATGVLHELGGATPHAFATATMLAARLAGLAAGTSGQIVWCSSPAERTRPFPPALAGTGLDPSRLIFVEVRDTPSRLMAIEEATGVAAAAILEARLEGEALMRASRRLQLAAGRAGTLLLWLAPGPVLDPMAADTRWRLAPLPSALPPVRPLFAGPGGVGLGRPRFRLELLRGRGLATPREWIVEMTDAASPGTAGLAVVPQLAHGPAAARPALARVAAAF